jgi:hypothetical protein
VQRPQPVRQVCRVEGDREWFAGEIDRHVLFGPADVVGTGRQPQHIVGEFHPDLRTAIGNQRDSLDRLSQFRHTDRGYRGVFGRQQLAELTEAIKRVALVADRGAQVRMEFSDDVLRLSAGADDVGRAEEDVAVDFVGEPLTIAFNPTYLTDGLGSLHSERVSFGFTTPSRPAVLRPAGDDDPQPTDNGPFPAVSTDYVYLLMPVRLPG